jgi:hypothetical protein
MPLSAGADATICHVVRWAVGSFGWSEEPGEPVEHERSCHGDVQAGAGSDHRDLHSHIQQVDGFRRDADLLMAEYGDGSLPRRRAELSVPEGRWARSVPAVAEPPSATGRWLAAGSLDSHLGGARTLILPGRTGPATRESA